MLLGMIAVTMRIVHVVLLCLLATTTACAGETDEDTGSSSDAARAARALPIRGDWTLVRWQGHVAVQSGSIEERQAVDATYEARERVGLATLDLDDVGAGSIRATGRCTLDLPTGGRPASPSAPRGAALAGGTFGLLSAIWQLVEMATCDPSKPTVRQVAVYAKRDFFGRLETRLWANIGVFGEQADTRAADAECRSLRGARWIVLGDGTAACVGYADAEARTLKMMVQRPSEIHVQRLTLTRAAGGS